MNYFSDDPSTPHASTSGETYADLLLNEEAPPTAPESVSSNLGKPSTCYQPWQRPTGWVVEGTDRKKRLDALYALLTCYTSHRSGDTSALDHLEVHVASRVGALNLDPVSVERTLAMISVWLASAGDPTSCVLEVTKIWVGQEAELSPTIRGFAELHPKLTYAEIAKYRGCSEITVKRHCQKLRGKSWRRGQKDARNSEARLWANVDKSSNGCWLWLGPTNGSGYGSLWANGATQGVHRLAYQYARGPIPAGMQIDHLCKVRTCCNPQHLEPVSRQENMMRAAIIPRPSAGESKLRQKDHLASTYDDTADRL